MNFPMPQSRRRKRIFEHENNAIGLGPKNFRCRKNASAWKFGAGGLSPPYGFCCRAAMAAISGTMAEKLSTATVDNVGEKREKSASLLSLPGLLKKEAHQTLIPVCCKTPSWLRLMTSGPDCANSCALNNAVEGLEPMLLTEALSEKVHAQGDSTRLF